MRIIGYLAEGSGKGGKEEPAKEKRGQTGRWWFEHVVGLPLGALDGEDFRTFVKRAAVFDWRETDKFADALEESSAAGLAAKSELIRKLDGEWTKVPESIFARLFMPSLQSLHPFMKAPAADSAAIAVFEARARGDRELGVINDPLGKPYKVTWSDDIVHFESASQWHEPHDLDVFVGRYDDYVKFRERLEREGARKSGT